MLYNLCDGFDLVKDMQDNTIYVKKDNNHIYIIFNKHENVQYIRTLCKFDRKDLKLYKKFLKNKIYKQMKKMFKENNYPYLYLYDLQERCKNYENYYVNNFIKDFIIFYNEEGAIELLIDEFCEEYSDDIKSIVRD